MDRRLLEYNPELEFSEALLAAEASAPASNGGESGDELADAADLLEVRSAEQLGRFLSTMMARGSSAGLALARSPLGPMLVGRLALAAQTVLPLRPTSLVPLVQARDANNNLKQRAAKVFGIELEGLSAEDKEFEVARHFVRFAHAAIANLASAPPALDPKGQVQMALVQAARKFAPGLLAQQARSGRWERQGGQIVVFAS